MGVTSNSRKQWNRWNHMKSAFVWNHSLLFFFRCVDRISFLLQRQTTNKEHVNRKSCFKEIWEECFQKLYTLVLQIPFQEVFRPIKPAQNTLSEGSWSTRDTWKSACALKSFKHKANQPLRSGTHGSPVIHIHDWSTNPPFNVPPPEIRA